MVLIPPDVGIRMRMQAEANLLRPVTQTHEIAADLPDLQPGQTFNARIQEALPNNSYRALVAGKQLTLQLPEGSKAGDALELIVIERSGKLVIAKPVQPNTGDSGEVVAYPFAKFSPAARMISQLLPAEGESPPASPLTRGQPLIAVPPQSQADAQLLAPTLAKAVSQSGLFYESHQAQWVTGQRPLADLLAEPQGQKSFPTAFQHADNEAMLRARAEAPAGHAPATTLVAPRDVGETTTPKVDAHSTLPSLPPGGNAGNAGNTSLSMGPQVSEEFRPIVQQQLEATATQRMVWHGEIWPRQTIEWEIDWQNEREGDGSEREELRWGTTLSLATPRLGQVDARLNLATDGVHIVLATPYGASAADMRDEAPKLAAALAAAGLPLLSLHIKHEDEVVTDGPPPAT